MNRALVPLALLALACLPALALAQEAAWRMARPDPVWSFPADHGSHPGYAIEWWYFTGHLYLEGASTPRFGYQFTFFRIGLDPAGDAGPSHFRAADSIMGHVALTDFERGEHRFSENFQRAAPLLGAFGAADAGPIAWSVAPPGTPDTWQLSWNGDGFDFAMQDDGQHIALRLATHPARPLVLHGAGGFSAKNADATAASLYYSFTRLATEGSVRIDDTTFAVRGTSWMDHEISTSQLDADQVGWDWFSLQLKDGRDLMLYLLRRSDGSVDHAQGTLVEKDGTSRHLAAREFTVTASGASATTHSGTTYPARWRVRVDGAGLDLDVRTRIPDQENASTLIDGLRYYEGSVVLTQNGAPAGLGYVELTGYGENAAVPLGEDRQAWR